jgi:hypothetical protein
MKWQLATQRRYDVHDKIIFHRKKKKRENANVEQMWNESVQTS